MSINQFLKENICSISRREDKCYVAPNIPEKKLANSVKSFNLEGDGNSIVAIIDSTAFGSAKEGLVFTGEKLISKSTLQDPKIVFYNEIISVENEVINEEKKENGTANKLKIYQENKQDPVSLTHIFLNHEKAAEFLNNLVNEFEEFEEQDQLQPLSELNDELKEAYINIIVNMAFDRNGQIDTDEFSEILRLMSRLEMNAEARENVRSYMAEGSNKNPVEEFVQVIDDNTPDGMQKSVHVSLVKDIISVQSNLEETVTADFDFMNENKKYFEVSEDDIDLAVMAIDKDKKMLDREYSDSDIQSNLKELSAKAGGAGVPLGAIYLSGSVTGMSAAGMTSGLSALGFGGALGLSSMATGIGTVAVVGIAAYKGVSHVLGTNIDEADKRREMMLQDIIKENQKTVNMVIEDINKMSESLSEAITNENVTKEKLKKLAKKLNQFAKASQAIEESNKVAENSKKRLQLPEYIDKERLKELCRDDEKYAYVMERYSEISSESGVSYKLANNISDKEIDSIAEILGSIDYSSTKGALKAKFKSGMNNE